MKSCKDSRGHPHTILVRARPKRAGAASLCDFAKSAGFASILDSAANSAASRTATATPFSKSMTR